MGSVTMERYVKCCRVLQKNSRFSLTLYHRGVSPKRIMLYRVQISNKTISGSNDGFWNCYFWKTGCCSIVWDIKFLKAAHRLDAEPWSAALSVLSEGLLTPFVPISVISARFFKNLSRSILSTFSRRFTAPGRCFSVFRLITLTWTPTPSRSFSSEAGNASAKEWRLATSFFDGRLRLGGFSWDFSTRDINFECLIMRLSVLVVRKPSSENPKFLGAGLTRLLAILLVEDREGSGRIRA